MGLFAQAMISKPENERGTPRKGDPVVQHPDKQPPPRIETRPIIATQEQPFQHRVTR